MMKVGMTEGSALDGHVFIESIVSFGEDYSEVYWFMIPPNDNHIRDPSYHRPLTIAPTEDIYPYLALTGKSTKGEFYIEEVILFGCSLPSLI